ncbi:HAD-IIB family hydrolase [Virgibacillus dakarensis]|uniref:5-amino-6-(5-phospho-D-ribitylamino)uracil phosphatase YcsE n=1 Tax=Lentibacillus populi TaxID=1827502 RepID=A0A9W5U0B8_9BACI|nr:MULTISPECIES: Cof-type HAD-IIB family hydrolase [Bacillaceae]MBT2216071.1 Cof-type HAD-IIB family hydrolase [Virgibacillus dakarensis]MTW87638.1 HAD-IIB family hydrolase [Virgibacillus dakarensis]GGB55106.1 5-amino-6-(5-phospho-D-ribitylamino)uracil phosphatase YcsE [Lentibacillus populi]
MEKKHEIKLVALDMDGTLLTSEQEVSKRTREAIAQALANDVHVVLSTGRWISSCRPFAESLNLTSYLVTVNGGEIWTFDKELKERHLIDTKLMEMMWELGAENDMTSWMVSTDDIWYDARPANFNDHEWLKIGFDSHDKEKLDDLVKKLSYHKELELSNSTPTNIEVNPIGVNKATALRSVCEWIGTTMNNVMAVGDSLNDIKMIQQGGIGIAMGNAQDAVKKAADFVTDTNNQDGVAKAIERFVL